MLRDAERRIAAAEQRLSAASAPPDRLASAEAAVSELESRGGIFGEPGLQRELSFRLCAGSPAAAAADASVSSALLSAGAGRVERAAQHLAAIDGALAAGALDAQRLDGAEALRVRCAALVVGARHRAERAERRRRAAAALLTAYGQLVDAATVLTLRVEARLRRKAQ